MVVWGSLHLIIWIGYSGILLIGKEVQCTPPQVKKSLVSVYDKSGTDNTPSALLTTLNSIVSGVKTMNAGYYSLPIISYDYKYLYINTYKNVLCINAADGTTVSTYAKMISVATPGENSFPVIANPVIDYRQNLLYAAGAGCIDDNTIYCIDISNPTNMKLRWKSPATNNIPANITKVSVLPNSDLIISSGITTDLYYWKSAGAISPKIAYMYTTKRIPPPPPPSHTFQQNKTYIYIAVAVLLILFVFRGTIYDIFENTQERTIVIIISTAIVIGAGIISIGLSG